MRPPIRRTGPVRCSLRSNGRGHTPGSNPWPTKPVVEDRFTIDDFRDQDAGTLTGPAGV